MENGNSQQSLRGSRRVRHQHGTAPLCLACQPKTNDILNVMLRGIGSVWSLRPSALPEGLVGLRYGPCHRPGVCPLGQVALDVFSLQVCHTNPQAEFHVTCVNCHLMRPSLSLDPFSGIPPARNSFPLCVQGTLAQQPVGAAAGHTASWARACRCHSIPVHREVLPVLLKLGTEMKGVSWYWETSYSV